MNDQSRAFELSWPENPARILRGVLTTPPGTGPWPIVVVAHGYALHKDWGFFPEITRRLTACGIATVRFNFSGHGVGEDLVVDGSIFVVNTYIDELRDLEVVRGWIETCSEVDSQRIGYLGHSRGGGMGLIHVAEDGRYRSVVTWATMEKTLQFSPKRIEQWRIDGYIEVMHWTARRRMKLEVATLHIAEREHKRLDIQAACTRLACPVVAIHGEDDRAIGVHASKLVAAACPQGELFTIADGDHVFGANHPLRDVGGALEQALARTVAAFSEL